MNDSHKHGARKVWRTRKIQSASCGFVAGSVVAPSIMFALFLVLTEQPEHKDAQDLAAAFWLMGALIGGAVAGVPKIGLTHAIWFIGATLLGLAWLGHAAETNPSLLLVVTATALFPCALVALLIKRTILGSANPE